jgi:hypothetical protein
MPEGFTVRLASIADFAETVNAVVDDYGAIGAQLNAADLKKVDPDFTTLLGVSNYAGSTEVNDAGRAMLGKYSELYSDLIRAHGLIKARLEYIKTALTDTHTLYAEHDAKHDAMFRGLLADLPGDQTGGDHGTAGSR